MQSEFDNAISLERKQEFLTVREEESKRAQERDCVITLGENVDPEPRVSSRETELRHSVIYQIRGNRGTKAHQNVRVARLLPQRLRSLLFPKG